jgi:hypothetical protein
MTRRGVLLLAALATAAACQTRRVARPAPETETPPGPEEARTAPDRPPVPASPAGLLAPGAARKIRDALVDRGLLAKPSGGDALDEAASAALRRFQTDEGLAATGFPDRETLRRLGLSPDEVYRDADDAAR